MYAVRKDNRDCVARLGGADDTIVDNDYGQTAFDMAVLLQRPYGLREFWEGMKTRECLNLKSKRLSDVPSLPALPPL